MPYPPLHAQLPSLKHLDLTLSLAGNVRVAELAADLGHLPLLGGLTALALRAGTICRLLGHMRLPPSVKARVPALVTSVLAQNHLVQESAWSGAPQQQLQCLCLVTPF